MRNDMDPYQKAIEDRIRDLHRYRRWIRNAPWADLFPNPVRQDMQREYRQEAGALNRVRNIARRATRVESRGDHFRYPIEATR